MASVIITAISFVESHAQTSSRSQPSLLLSGGAAIVTDNRITFGIPPVVVVSLGLSAKEPSWEFTLVTGRAIVVAGAGIIFGIESGINVSLDANGTYGGIVLSRTGSANDAIFSLGARLGQRPVRGRGLRYEVRTEFAREDDIELFLAYVSVGYDFSRR